MSELRNGCRGALRAAKLSDRVLRTTCHTKLFNNSLRIKRKYFKIPSSCQGGTGDNLVNISHFSPAGLCLLVKLRIDLLIPLPTIMKQIKQISPGEAFTGILLGDHLSCNSIKFLITGGRGLRHRTFLLHTSLLLLLHLTQVDIS